MSSQKVVTPVKTGAQSIGSHSKRLDSGCRRNDKNGVSTIYETNKV
jgi:hypothetical protein